MLKVILIAILILAYALPTQLLRPGNGIGLDLLIPVKLLPGRI